eukprot:947890-Pyramimonas_sp.AAC.1
MPARSLAQEAAAQPSKPRSQGKGRRNSTTSGSPQPRQRRGRSKATEAPRRVAFFGSPASNFFMRQQGPAT